MHGTQPQSTWLRSASIGQQPGDPPTRERGPRAPTHECAKISQAQPRGTYAPGSPRCVSEPSRVRQSHPLNHPRCASTRSWCCFKTHVWRLPRSITGERDDGYRALAFWLQSSRRSVKKAKGGFMMPAHSTVSWGGQPIHLLQHPPFVPERMRSCGQLRR